MNLRKLFKKECRHGFDLNDVIDLTKEPGCKLCGKLLSDFKPTTTVRNLTNK